MFLFRSKRADYLKILYYDGTGLCLSAKRIGQDEREVLEYVPSSFKGDPLRPDALAGAVALSRRRPLEMTNNAAERAMRGPVLGRKNYRSTGRHPEISGASVAIPVAVGCRNCL